ncbi:MAG: M1 family metallopeptidase [Phycisphaerae bacterium]|nr:M1 family metallopeptidase [Gemmatimonadaceae bacterium]
MNGSNTRFLTAIAVVLTTVSSTMAAQGTALPNQGPNIPAIPIRPATTPPGNDTVGYWQQRADYRIVATLDESMNAVHATGTLTYVNRSPDTLNELWLHQHLNAFRPGSRWSAVDVREGRVRFQNLRDPDYAYERFTAPPVINGVAVRAEYPIAPDSTVVRLALPRPLASGDSVVVQFAWDARPSTLPRRQARRVRSYDFAQWYPKVAVYDRQGWHPNALVPAGEFYGEFGTFDVTMVLPADQVVGATGVPVSGDPGWARVALPGSKLPRLAAEAYPDVPASPQVAVAPGARAVRFYARNVHEFAWSISPGFRYESAEYVRSVPVAGLRFPVWTTVPVHVLYRIDAPDDCARLISAQPADTISAARRIETCVNNGLTGWRDGKSTGYGMTALTWLESIYGPYAYPQMTILKRADGGGTEFPMMQQNGSASLGLTLHEGGHIYTFGILGNNEWQSGWMDEGLTSYQTAWQGGNVRVALAAKLAALNPPDPALPGDITLQEARTRLDTTAVRHDRMVKEGIAEPIGTRGDLFRNFTVYNNSVYARAQLMYQALHDVLGDRVFRDFLKDYYSRWALRHVDRWAMQGSAERVSKLKLDWFFNQWVNNVGTIDYALRSPSVQKTARGWTVRVNLEKVGTYRHPMPVGVRTAKGWVLARGDASRDSQLLEIQVTSQPDGVWLDPLGSTDSQTARFYRLSLR